MNRLDFSLVTTCRNEIKSFDSWKQNIIDQTRPPSEIVIVDAFSDDGTAEKLFEWAKSDTRVKVIQEKGAAAHGRNHAIRNTKYEIILSTDMGVRLSSNWCEELIAHFEVDDTIEVVAGNSCIDLESLKIPIAWAEYYHEKGGFLTLQPGCAFGNRSVGYRKSCWHKMGELPEDLTFYGDDQVFSYQILQNGIKIAYAPNAMTFWCRPDKASQFYKESYNYGFGDGEALIKTPRAIKLYRAKVIPRFLVPLSSGLIQVFKNFSFRQFFNTLREKGFKIAIWLPILLFKRGYHHSKGYIVGMKRGEIHCVKSRNRLVREANGYFKTNKIS